ncbi:MAG: hypothetical protein NTZ87_01335 [Candidatus Nomurabacteria bacterium]|nr:hypothetical protein [Candidatus Nomurabacteria bacterium]
MSPEEKELLRRSLSLAEENNGMLHSMRRSMRMASIMRALYWIIIIGSAFGAYYYIQPYTDQIMKIYNEAQSNLGSLSTMLQNIKK